MQNKEHGTINRRKALSLIGGGVLVPALVFSHETKPSTQTREQAPQPEDEFSAFRTSVVEKIRNNEPYVGTFTDEQLSPLIESIGNYLVDQKLKEKSISGNVFRATIGGVSTSVTEQSAFLKGAVDATITRFFNTSEDFTATLVQDKISGELTSITPEYNKSSKLISAMTRVGFDREKIDTYFQNPQQVVTDRLNDVFVDDAITIEKVIFDLRPNRATIQMNGRPNTA